MKFLLPTMANDGNIMDDRWKKQERKKRKKKRLETWGIRAECEWDWWENIINSFKVRYEIPNVHVKIFNE